MNILASTNATLTKIAEGGFTENYSDDETAGSALWQGSERVYVDEQHMTVEPAGSTNVIERDVLIVGYAVGSFAKPDCVVTYTDDETGVQTRKVRSVRGLRALGASKLVFADTPEKP
jgi:hypothetical protein